MEEHGSVLTDGCYMSQSDFQLMTAFVEQEDALIGSLTVRETISFALRLSSAGNISRSLRQQRVNRMLAAFGLTSKADTLIGTPIRKGVSGGEKRRTSIAAQLITQPRILFLDEPTSGLDSTASYEVISYLRKYARQHQILVVASIHQPSTSTFNLFDKLLLLSQGKPCYFGTLRGLKPYFALVGQTIPTEMNPAEHLLDLVNVDFAHDRPDAQSQLASLHRAWAHYSLSILPPPHNPEKTLSNTHDLASSIRRASLLSTTTSLLHRSFIKSYRDIIAYGIRLAMYLGLAIMMGTVWLRLPTTQSSIQPFINAIFFGSAFMSFMAVAYVPAFLEDRTTFASDRANGLATPLAFCIANFLIGIPYLFLFALAFSVVAYWLTNLRPDGAAFMTWVMWVFLDLLAAESLVVLVSCLLPNFVLALAVTAFANGLWMCVGGFLVSPKVLNVFWRYVFHYIDYQAYVFQGMMVNEFSKRMYDCADGCRCAYDSPLAAQCKIDGSAVLGVYGYRTGRTGKWVGILLAIVAVYRVLGYLALRFRR